MHFQNISTVLATRQVNNLVFVMFLKGYQLLLKNQIGTNTTFLVAWLSFHFFSAKSYWLPTPSLDSQCPKLRLSQYESQMQLEARNIHCTHMAYIFFIHLPLWFEKFHISLYPIGLACLVFKLYKLSELKLHLFVGDVKVHVSYIYEAICL